MRGVRVCLWEVNFSKTITVQLQIQSSVDTEERVLDPSLRLTNDDVACFLIMFQGDHYVYTRWNDADELPAPNTHCKAAGEITGHETTQQSKNIGRV
jgi:hypothetical protein